MNMVLQSQSKPKPKPNHKKTQTHRARVEVVHSILNQALKFQGEGIPRFRLQCFANLSNRQMNEYTKFMVANGLLFVTYDNSLYKGKPRMLYHSSQKGILFMRLYDSMHKSDLLYGVTTK
jgi:predicted transcriptional regulator